MQQLRSRATLVFHDRRVLGGLLAVGLALSMTALVGCGTEDVATAESCTRPQNCEPDFTCDGRICVRGTAPYRLGGNRLDFTSTDDPNLDVSTYSFGAGTETSGGVTIETTMDAGTYQYTRSSAGTATLNSTFPEWTETISLTWQTHATGTYAYSATGADIGEQTDAGTFEFR